MNAIGPRPRGRSGAAAFTLIELLIVLLIAGILAALAAPKALELIRRSGLTRATAAINEVAATARRIAQRQDPPAAGLPYPCFGVIVVDDGTSQPWTAVTWGVNSPPLPGDVLLRKLPQNYGEGVDRLWRTWTEYNAAADELDAAGQTMPVSRLILSGSLRFHRPPAASPLDSQPLGGSWGWLVQYQSGATIAAADAGAVWTDVGLDPLLVVRDVQGQMVAAMAVYAAGVTHVSTLR